MINEERGKSMKEGETVLGDEKGREGGGKRLQGL